MSVAATACKQLPNSPRALTLYASVLMKDPIQIPSSRAKSLLEKALTTDPGHLPAVYMLVEILDRELQLPEAIALLQKQLVIQSTCKLHQLLGDLLVKTHDEEKALDHYHLGKMIWNFDESACDVDNARPSP